jgi:dCTP deaminase
MTLSDRDIKKAIQAGKIKIDPMPNFETQLGSCSIDLRLGDEIKFFNPSKNKIIDVKKLDDVNETMETIKISDEHPLIIQPNNLVLATTIEWLEISDDLLGRIEGRSSLGRIGVIVHGTASVFDPGWRGKPVLELGNIGVLPVILYPGMRICSFTFEETSSPVEIPYYLKKNNKYSGQENPLTSKLSQDFKNLKK